MGAAQREGMGTWLRAVTGRESARKDDHHAPGAVEVTHPFRNPPFRSNRVGSRGPQDRAELQMATERAPSEAREPVAGDAFRSGDIRRSYPSPVSGEVILLCPKESSPATSIAA